MNHVAKASQHVFHESPLDGLFEDIHHVFDDRLGRDPFASLHEVAHHTRTESGERELRHADFQRSMQRGHHAMLAIMDMMRQMTRPLIEEHHAPLQVHPPRGLVALACHRDAVTYCQRFYSCWKGMTQCLARHRDDIQPRCKHLLEVSGISLSEAASEDHDHDHHDHDSSEERPEDEDEDEDDEKREQAETKAAEAKKEAERLLGEAKAKAKGKAEKAAKAAAEAAAAAETKAEETAAALK